MCEALRELFAEDIENARKQGEKVGLQNGLQTGFQNGLQSGLQSGLQNGLRAKAEEVALNLSHMGMAIDDIAKAVGMQVSVVQEWLRKA